jgi:flavin-dependent trigonelline monooxygenase, reductase component
LQKGPGPEETDVQTGLKDVMRHFPQGVTVVTTTSPEGPKGMTVSSFTSISLTPPLVLVSLAKGSDLHDLFVNAKAFAVNFLAEDQKSVSDLFAGRVKVKERFDQVKSHSGVTGAPLIDGVRAVIECRTWRVEDGGDHSIMLGEVVGAAVASKRRPLVYYSQQYTTVERSEQPAPPSDIVW